MRVTTHTTDPITHAPYTLSLVVLTRVSDVIISEGGGMVGPYAHTEE